jgi:hypothetical protein
MNKLITSVNLKGYGALELWLEYATGSFRIKWQDGMWFNTRIDSQHLAEDILNDMVRCFNKGYESRI